MIRNVHVFRVSEDGYIKYPALKSYQVDINAIMNDAPKIQKEFGNGKYEIRYIDYENNLIKCIRFRLSSCDCSIQDLMKKGCQNKAHE